MRIVIIGPRVWLAAALGMVVPLAAQAQQPTGAESAAVRASCRADFQSHCGTVPPGGDAALACLQQNVATLSSPCQQALAALGTAPAGPPTNPLAPPSAPAPGTTMPPPSIRTEARFLRQFCAEDYRRLCQGVRPRGGAGLACLNDHARSLAPGCQQALKAADAPH